MRRTLIFDDEITLESINNLISDIVSYEGEIDLFFSTIGGGNIETTALIHFLNNECKDKLKIFFTGLIGSNGIEVFIDYKGEKYITEDLDTIIIHTSSRTIDSRNRQVLNGFLDIENEDTKVRLKKYSKFFKFTKEEKERFKKGGDVIILKINFDRFSDKITYFDGTQKNKKID